MLGNRASILLARRSAHHVLAVLFRSVVDRHIPIHAAWPNLAGIERDISLFFGEEKWNGTKMSKSVCERILINVLCGLAKCHVVLLVIRKSARKVSGLLSLAFPANTHRNEIRPCKIANDARRRANARVANQRDDPAGRGGSTASIRR